MPEVGQLAMSVCVARGGAPGIGETPVKRAVRPAQAGATGGTTLLEFHLFHEYFFAGDDVEAGGESVDVALRGVAAQ